MHKSHSRSSCIAEILISFPFSIPIFWAINPKPSTWNLPFFPAQNRLFPAPISRSGPSFNYEARDLCSHCTLTVYGLQTTTQYLFLNWLYTTRSLVINLIPQTCKHSKKSIVFVLSSSISFRISRTCCFVNMVLLLSSILPSSSASMVYKKIVESTSKFAIAQKYEAIFKYGYKTIHENEKAQRHADQTIQNVLRLMQLPHPYSRQLLRILFQRKGRLRAAVLEIFLLSSENQENKPIVSNNNNRSLIG